MATKLIITHTKFLSSLLLLCVLLFAFPTANALTLKDKELFCKDTHDTNFCLDTFGKAPVHNVTDLFKNAVWKASRQAGFGIEFMERNRHMSQYTKPIGKRRLDFCLRSYKLAATSFENAYQAASKNSFANNRKDMYNSIQTGLEAVKRCENGWVKDGPVQRSPVTADHDTINNLYLLSLVCLNKLSKSP